jgi:hypothetical protein
MYNNLGKNKVWMIIIEKYLGLCTGEALRSNLKPPDRM